MRGVSSSGSTGVNICRIVRMVPVVGEEGTLELDDMTEYRLDEDIEVAIEVRKRWLKPPVMVESLESLGPLAGLALSANANGLGMVPDCLWYARTSSSVRTGRGGLE